MKTKHLTLKPAHKTDFKKCILDKSHIDHRFRNL